MKKNQINTSLIIGAFLVIIFGFMLFTFQVREGEVAIKTRFGKAVLYDDLYVEGDTLPDGKAVGDVKTKKADIGPGLHLRLPWPVHDVHIFDKRIQSSEWAFEQTGTRNAQPILITVFVTWRISEAELFNRRHDGDLAKADDLLKGKVRSAQNAVIGKYAFNELVSTNKDELKLDEIEEEMKTRVAEASKVNGIEIIMVGIKRLGIPESVTGAVFERMKAERQAEIQKIAAEGERQAMEIKAKADLEANKILAQARAEAIQISGQAEAQTAKYYEVFKQNPELANFLFQRKALEGLLKENSTLILDPNTPPFNLLTQPDATKAAKP
jgi:membrane protease subunit HflC